MRSTTDRLSTDSASSSDDDDHSSRQQTAVSTNNSNNNNQVKRPPPTLSQNGVNAKKLKSDKDLRPTKKVSAIISTNINYVLVIL